MLQIIKARALPIGIDLGCSSVKIAQLQFTKDNLVLLAAGAAEIPPEHRKDPAQRLEFLCEEISQILATHGFKGRQCVLSLPAEDTFVQHIKMPKLDPDETARTLPAELQGKLPYPVGDAIVRHIVAGETYCDGQTKQEVIAVATAKSTMDAYLRMARRAKLNPIGVNVEACAIVECFSRLFRRSTDSARTILFVDLGAASTQAVLSQGENIAFARNLAMGANQLNEDIACRMGITAEQAQALRRDLLKEDHDPAKTDDLYKLMDDRMDAIAGELTKCLRYYESVFRNQTIERAIFLGGGAYDKRLCQSIAQRLNLPAQIGDPFLQVKRVNGAGLDIGLDLHCPQPNWAVAVGLSLGASRAA